MSLGNSLDQYIAQDLRQLRQRQTFDASLPRSYSEENIGTAEWLFVQPLGKFGDDVEAVLSTVLPAIAGAKAITEVSRDVLELIKVVASLVITPYEVLVSEAIRVIESFVSGLLNSGISSLLQYSDYDRPLSVQEQFNLLAQSVEDFGDPHRPIVPQSINAIPFPDLASTEPAGWVTPVTNITGPSRVDMAVVTFVCPSIQSVLALVDIVKDIIKIPEIKLYEQQPVDPLRSPPADYPWTWRYPDWQSVKLAELFPAVKAFAGLAQQLIDFIGYGHLTLLKLIDDTITIIARKLQKIERLITLIDNILVGIQQLLSIGPVIVWRISGTFTASELRKFIAEANSFNPFNMDNFGLTWAVALSSPINVETGLPSSDSFGPTFDAINLLLGNT